MNFFPRPSDSYFITTVPRMQRQQKSVCVLITPLIIQLISYLRRRQRFNNDRQTDLHPSSIQRRQPSLVNVQRPVLVRSTVSVSSVPASSVRLAFSVRRCSSNSRNTKRVLPLDPSSLPIKYTQPWAQSPAMPRSTVFVYFCSRSLL